MLAFPSTLRARKGSSARKALLALAPMLAFLLFCLPLSAQLNTGRISGQVTDQSGGAIAGARVTVIDIARGQNRELVSDAAGQYAAPNLIPGIYTVRAEFMGFQTIERQNVQVEVGSDVRADLTLQPGSQTQTVTVTEALPIVNATNAQTGAPPRAGHGCGALPHPGESRSGRAVQDAGRAIRRSRRPRPRPTAGRQAGSARKEE